MKNYKWIAVGLTVAVALLGVTLFFELDIFERFCQWLTHYESFELDEFVFPLLIILLFILADLIHRARARRIKAAEKKIYRAMVQASDHVLKNCLNQMLIIKYAAQETPGFDPEVLESFDAIMAETMVQIEALGNLKEVDKESIGKSLKIKIFE
jgi:hypothetical protein